MKKPENNQKNNWKKRFSSLKISNITFPEETIKAAHWVHFLLWSLLGIFIFLSVVSVFWPHLLWHHFEIVDYPLHSTVESLGAVAAILIALLPLQVLFGKHRPSFVFLSTGFLVMGLLDLFHSFYKIGNGFVFTHALALHLGGFFFALFVIPWKTKKLEHSKKYFMLLGTFITVFLAIIASLNRDFFPEMIDEGVFTPMAKSINLIGGLFFLISAVKLFTIYIREKNLGVLILVITAISSAIVGITFEYSTAWSDGWWLWHFIRLFAFLAVLGYMFWRIQAVSDERNEAFKQLKDKHNQLTESEKQFRIIFENSPLGKSLTGLDGSLSINKSFSEITGYNLEELQQKNWKEITHPDDVKKSEEVIKSLLAGEQENINFEKRYLHKDGRYIWAEVNTALHRNEAGEPQFFITAIADISKRKEAEEIIKQSGKKFKGLFKNDPSAILIADPETGLLTDVNPAAEELMEMTRDELIGLHQSKLHPAEIVEEQFEKFKKLQGQPNVTVESIVITKSGKRKPVEIKVAIVEINGKPQILGIFHDISMLVEEQEKLKQSEAKHRAIFESATDAFLIVSMEGEIVEANPSACQIYGYNYDEIIGREVPSIIHPDYHHKFNEFMQDIQEKGMYSGETVDLRKDGTTFQTEVNGTLINFNNEPHMLGIIRDVTDKKEWENELKLKNIVFESSIAANSTSDLEGNINSVNKSFLKIWGYENKKEVVGKPISNFIKYEKEAGEILQGLISDGKWQGKYTAQKKDGSTFIAEANATVLYNSDGEKIGYQSSVFDVTQRIQAEQEREKANYDLKQRIKEISCLFEINEAIKDPDVNIPEVMQKVTKAVPRGMQNPQKTSVKVLLDSQQYTNDNYKETNIFIEEIITTNNKPRGKVQVFVFDLDKKQEKLPFLKEEKQLLSTIANNIGIYVNRVESAQKLDKAMEKLRNSNKELEQFAYVASHDLQEPLRMVSSYTQLLERRYKGQLDDRADKYIYYAVDGANRMQNLINDLLDFSRVSTRGEKFEPIDTNEVLKNVTNSLSYSIEESGAKINTSQLPDIKGDKTQVERVFQNLIANAIKFRTTDKKPVISVNAKSQGKKWLFSVKDNGIGIDEKFQDKVFVIFQRLHGGNQFKGTGIGLAICKRIVQRHGGEIWFDSEEGKGTTFFFTIKK